MSKVYTKQDPKDGTSKVEWEVSLRHGDEYGEFYLDVREDIVDSDGDVVNGGRYVEGFIFDDYNEAGKKFIEMGNIYEEKVKISPLSCRVLYNNEVEA
tara:strand:+ start:3028 stop:3321 length:294 start_codon:yes stop_codon:yes gene_type:complete